jgi:hypothetical protein
VVLFKKLGQHIPHGITSDSLVEFFTRQFAFSNEAEKADAIKTTTKLIGNSNYHVLAILCGQRRKNSSYA